MFGMLLGAAMAVPMSGASERAMLGWSEKDGTRTMD
jgi:hypothetical protein